MKKVLVFYLTLSESGNGIVLWVNVRSLRARLFAKLKKKIFVNEITHREGD
jgi:hypothetical protein